MKVHTSYLTADRARSCKSKRYTRYALPRRESLSSSGRLFIYASIRARRKVRIYVRLCSSWNGACTRTACCKMLDARRSPNAPSGCPWPSRCPGRHRSPRTAATPNWSRGNHQAFQNEHGGAVSDEAGRAPSPPNVRPPSRERRASIATAKRPCAARSARACISCIQRHDASASR